MTVVPADAEQLLGVSLSSDDPAEAARTAAALQAAAERVAQLARGVADLLPVARWSGVASEAADERLVEVALALTQERARLLRAAGELSVFSHAVADARTAADEAAALVGAARQLQQDADARDRSLAVSRAAGGWSGPRADGSIYDPDAVALLRRARERAFESRSACDRAARVLVAQLTALSGRRVVRAGLSARVLLDVAGFVPVVGDAVDAVNALVYLKERRWVDALTGAAAVPGPEGWLAGGTKIGKAVDHVGDVERVVDDVPAEARAAEVLGGLTVRGRRSTTRMLPDDDSVEGLYRKLEPLGATEVRPGTRGDIFVTTLPSGAKITFRRFSGSEGFTIEIFDLPDVALTRIHRPRPLR